MKKILISTPLKGGLDPIYVRSLISVLATDWKGKYNFQWAVTTGTSVAMARDELAGLALRENFDEQIWWDKDICAGDPNMMLGMFARILSHDVDIVAGQYVGHNFLSQFHGASLNEPPRKDGLMRMGQIPIGFSKVKVSVYRKIMQTHPWHKYAMKQTEDTVARPDLFEFFPNGIVGACSDSGKMERLRMLMKETTDGNPAEYMDAVKKIVAEDNYGTNYMMGEDFYFCKIAREAGFDLWTDNNLIIPHETGVRLPVNNDTLTRAFMEEWRWADSTKPVDMTTALNGLRKLLGPNHA